MPDFTQNSTWRGIIAIIGAVAIIIRPDAITEIVPAMMILIGSINFIRNPQ